MPCPFSILRSWKNKSPNLTCSIKESKYFGRFIRSIGYAYDYSDNPIYNKLLTHSIELDNLKKERGINKYNSILCTYPINLYENLITLFNKNWKIIIILLII